MTIPYAVTVPGAPPPESGNTLPIDGETYTFGSVIDYGTFADGKIGWVYVPSGTVSLLSPSTMPTGSGATYRNGVEKNPTRDDAASAQGYDGRGPAYTSGRSATFPMTLTAGDAVVQVISCEETYRPPEINNNVISDGGCQVIVQKWVGFHVVDYIPAADELAPPLVGTVRTRHTPDLDAIVAAAPSYALTTDYMPAASILFYWDRLNLSPAQVATYADPGLREMVPAGSSFESGYGEYMAATLSDVMAMYVSDKMTSAEKKTTLIRALTHTIQWYHPHAEDGIVRHPNGGQNNYIVELMVFGLRWLGLTAAADGLRTNLKGNALAQHMYLDATDVSRITTPHSNDGAGWPRISRTRAITGVSSLTLTFEGFSDAMQLIGMNVKRVGGDGATARITAQSGTGASQTVTIAAQPGNPFTTADSIVFQPAYALTAGVTPVWHIAGYPLDRETISFSPDQIYFGNNPIGWVLAAHALGFMHSNFDALLDFFAMTAPGNFPNSAAPYSRRMAGSRDPLNGFSYTFYTPVQQLYAAHWPAISAIAQVG